MKIQQKPQTIPWESAADRPQRFHRARNLECPSLGRIWRWLICWWRVLSFDRPPCSLSLRQLIKEGRLGCPKLLNRVDVALLDAVSRNCPQHGEREDVSDLAGSMSEMDELAPFVSAAKAFPYHCGAVGVLMRGVAGGAIRVCKHADRLPAGNFQR